MNKRGDRYQGIKVIGWVCVGLVYLLTLVTQLPHILDVYAGIERRGHQVFGISTAAGAAVAFEASVAIFTLRLIVSNKGERSRWTRAGVMAFLGISAVANVSYYFDITALDEKVMPLILAVALPAALWLYAEEFGRGAKAQARRLGGNESEVPVAASEPIAEINEPTAPQEPERYWLPCPDCGWVGRKAGYNSPEAAQNALNAHKCKDAVALSDNGRETNESDLVIAGVE